MLYRNKTWPVKQENFISLGRNDTSMVRWMCNVKILAVKLEIEYNCMPCKSIYKTENCHGLVSKKECKGIPGLVNVKNLSLVVVQLKDNLQKHAVE